MPDGNVFDAQDYNLLHSKDMLPRRLKVEFVPAHTLWRCPHCTCSHRPEYGDDIFRCGACDRQLLRPHTS